HHDRWDWTIGLCLIIPEVLWFDALTSRETVAMSLIVCAVLQLGAFLLFPATDSADRFARRRLIAGALSLAALGLSRTTMLIPTFASLVVLYVSAGGNWRLRARGAAWILIAGLI